MKLGKLVNSKEALELLIKKEIDVDKAFDLAVAVKSVSDEITAFHEIRKNKIIEYGEKIENGNFRLKDENVEKFSEEMKVLEEKEIEIVFPKLTKEDFKREIGEDGTPKKLFIETAILLQLDFLFA